MKKISIVVPAYNEEGNVGELVNRIDAAFNELKDYDYKIIFVENGSTDNTFEKLMSLQKLNERIQIIKLSRNFKDIFKLQLHFRKHCCPLFRHQGNFS